MAYARPRQDQEPLTWEDLNLERTKSKASLYQNAWGILQ